MIKRQLKSLILRYKCLFSDIISEFSEREFFRLFFIFFVVYGGAIFFTHYAGDDIARYYYNRPYYYEVDFLGRWLTGILNHFVFNRYAHVLHYLNSILFVLSITLSTLFSAYALKIEKSSHRLIFCIVVGINVSFAEQLFFNTNITNWFALFFAVFAVYLLSKSLKFFILSTILLICSLGIYQTNFQVAIILIIMIFMKDFFKITNARDYRLNIYKYIIILLILIASYYLNDVINKIIMHINHLEPAKRYALFENITIKDIFHNVYNIIFKASVGIVTFYTDIFAIFMYIYIVHYGVKSKRANNTSVVFIIINIIFLTISFIVLKLAVFLPSTVGINDYGLRGLYAMFWSLGAFAYFSLYYFKYKLGKYIVTLFIIIYLLPSIFDINISTDRMNTMTNSEIITANNIVTRIRMNKDYQAIKSKPKFLIIGSVCLLVKGSCSQSALTWKPWAPFIFINFTNFKFTYVTDDMEKKKILVRLAMMNNNFIFNKGKNIVVVDDTVVLVLDPKIIYRVRKSLENNRTKDNL